MPTTTYYQPKFVLAGKVDHCNHISYIFASGDQSGSLLDHTVVDPKSLLVTSIAGTKQPATQA